MEYICDNCNEEFSLKKGVKCCPYCTFKFIREKQSPMKKFALIEGKLEGVLKVIIFPNGYIEFIDFKGEVTVLNDYKILQSQEINEKEYYSIINEH